MSALVLEELTSRQVRFLRAEFVEREDKSGTNLSLVQLGAMVSGTELQKSELVKYRSVSHMDPRTKKFYQVGIAVRASGRFEVYSDFVLVNE